MWVAVYKCDEMKAILHLVERTLSVRSLVSVKMPQSERVLLMEMMQFLKDKHQIGVCWKSLKSDSFAYLSACYIYS